MLTARQAFRWWAYFSLLTVAAAVPLVAAYIVLGDSLAEVSQAQHRQLAQRQLDRWKEKIESTIVSAWRETYDDALLLGNYDQKALLINSLKWQLDEIGSDYFEGMAILGQGGELVAGVIADQASPANGRAKADNTDNTDNADKTDVGSPWLMGYRFVWDHFLLHGASGFYLSRLIKTGQRRILIAAAPARDDHGRLLSVVMAQLNAAKLFASAVRERPNGLDVWVMDDRGDLAYTGGPFALASAGEYALSRQKSGAALIPKPAPKTDSGPNPHPGAELIQTINGVEVRTHLAAVRGRYLMGVVERQSVTAVAAERGITVLGSLALICLALLALAGVVYTLIFLNRESRSIELTVLRRYTGTMAHRIRNELTTMNGVIEFCKSGRVTDPEDIQKNIAPLLDQAAAGIKLTVDQLEDLAFGRADLEYDGQAGENTLYGVDQSKNKSSPAGKGND